MDEWHVKESLEWWGVDKLRICIGEPGGGQLEGRRWERDSAEMEGVSAEERRPDRFVAALSTTPDSQEERRSSGGWEDDSRAPPRERRRAKGGRAGRVIRRGPRPPPARVTIDWARLRGES